ncbi:hypothetical protein KC660_03870 [Candidatus Dojkabacteria bacterium]|uniref:Uncharacterized protein n=1 Tax=Candidatus Dojkabacteria bacterium TaxID=2099670 RepID=A0A955L470_9BACT|nr:hypothetical protein [Candidatus Dojkabacteria bacterium]
MNTHEGSNDTITIILYSFVGIILLCLILGGIFILLKNNDTTEKSSVDNKTNSIDYKDQREITPDSDPKIKQDNFPKDLENIKQI